MNNYNTNRKNDTVYEKATHNFLDEYLYPKVGDFETVSDKERQINGIDVVMHTNKGDFYIDEKTATKYHDKILSTYSLELSFINKAFEVMKGWFLQDNDTQIYELNYIFTRNNSEPLTKDDITKVISIFVFKEDILKWLEKQGITKESLWDTQCDIRDSYIPYDVIEVKDNGHGGYKFFTENKNISYYYSSFYGEEPINILISRYIYEKLSIAIYITTPEGVKKVRRIK